MKNMNYSTLILLMDGDRDTMRANRASLELEGYQVLEADTLEKGRTIAEDKKPDLIVLDIMLPDGNGLNYCRELREQSGVRILFLSALNTKADVIEGLQSGGDDYIAKPYLIDELVARVQALLRRGALTRMEDTPLCVGRLELHLLSRRAYLHGENLFLRAKEFSLLELLVKNRERYMPADEIYTTLWDADALNDVRTIKEHISRLRHKLEGSGATIESARGRGYQLKIADSKIR